MDLDWTRLGKALRDARRAAPVPLTQEEMAEALGVGRSVIQLIEGGNKYKKPTHSMRAYAARVGWEEGSIERVLAGGEPTLKGATPPAPTPDVPAETGLPLRIVHELKGRGDLLDTAVIPLGDDASMVVVVKGKPGASVEEIERSLEAWREAQGQLMELDYRRAAAKDEPSGS
ncbi:helix-turn-helix domain-containing protein [Streptomyces lateritius]|uniref:helix-turn-helix domain-containing protein n=1 Tax=Streptomyces lateritius TaxID=67313 RepID=UPI001C8B2A62|nr:helix-turn-helix transcriptional regulator [Streptomyces lateritius]MBX9425495.1 helix-turn-helix domain-containing protein [Streptomyces lateritius]